MNYLIVFSAPIWLVINRYGTTSKESRINWFGTMTGAKRHAAALLERGVSAKVFCRDDQTGAHVLCAEKPWNAQTNKHEGWR